MAERVVKVRLTAEVNSYLSNMDAVAKKTRDGRTEAQQLAKTLEAQKKAFEVTGRAMLVAGGVVAAGLVLATKRAADFDAAMSDVQAATHESAANMRLLREAALEAGASTVFSAQESAGAIEELAKAGLSTNSIIRGGLTGALDLAAAGNMAVADAAGVASTTLQQFNLSGDKASHVADVLAAGAGKAMGDVSDLSMALGQSGTVAAQFGLSLEETTGSLAAFASNGLLGSDAGTSFRAMLLRLANPTGEAAAKMEELGIQAYDAQGNFIGMTGLAGQLEKGLAGLTQEQRNAALAIIFGQDAIRSANILYEEGARGIEEWTRKVDDAGYAAETAEKRLDNLNGDLEKLSGAFDSALISLGESGQGPLRAVVQGITGVVDGFNELPDGAQTAVYWIGAVGSAATLAGGTALLAVPKIAAYKVAMGELGDGAQSAARGLGRVAAVGGGALAGLAVGMGVLEGLKAALAAIGPSAEEVSNQIKTAADAVEVLEGAQKKVDLFGNTSTKLAAAQIRDLGAALDDFEAGGGRNPVFANLMVNLEALGGELAKIAETDLPAAQRQFRMLAESGDLTEKQQGALLDRMGPFKDELSKQATEADRAATAQSLLKDAMGESTPEVESAADAYRENADQVNGLRDALRELTDQMNAQNSLEQQAIQANADWIAGLAELTTQVQENGASLDQTTAAGSANAAMLAGLASDAQAAAQAQFEVDQTTLGAEEASRRHSESLAAQRAKFEEAAIAAGFNAEEVRKLAEKIFSVPTERHTKMLVDTSEQYKLDNFRAALNRIPNYKGVTVDTIIGNPSMGGGALPGGFHGGIAEFYARGGLRDLVPLSKIASFVGPNTWRVIGDRATHDEAFIPLDGSPRSWRILTEANRRMPGSPPQYMAQGGFVQPQYARQAPFYQADLHRAGTADSGPRAVVNLVNPVVRDLQQDAWEAAQIIGGVI